MFFVTVSGNFFYRKVGSISLLRKIFRRALLLDSDKSAYQVLFAPDA